MPAPTAFERSHSTKRSRKTSSAALSALEDGVLPEKPRGKSAIIADPERPKPIGKKRRSTHSSHRVAITWRDCYLAFNSVFGWSVLLPLCLLSFMALGQALWPFVSTGLILNSEPFRIFLVGGLLMGGIYYIWGTELIATYVFAHEYTHLLTARLFGSRLHDMYVSRTGGYVEVTRSNVFISLSPYVIPFYTVLMIAGSYVLSHLVDLNAVNRLQIGQLAVPFHPPSVFHFLLGYTWAFHFLYTVRSLQTKQSDLQRNGESFSLILIILLNLFLVAWIFVFTTNLISWSSLAESFGWAFQMLRWATHQLVIAISQLIQQALATPR
jgi:hypothetical protein